MTSSTPSVLFICRQSRRKLESLVQAFQSILDPQQKVCGILMTSLTLFKATLLNTFSNKTDRAT